jgi:hypothetical protein
MPDVSSRKCGTPRDSDTSDLRITHVHSSPFCRAAVGDAPAVARGAVEIQYAVLGCSIKWKD